MTKNISRYPRRARNELHFRELTVLCVGRISADFQRIILDGDALDGFTSRDSDDHTKASFPESDSDFIPSVITDEGTVWADGVRPLSHNHTPLHDEARYELVLNFYTHDGGMASMWAMNAREGDKLAIGGPRGSLVIPEGYTYQAYVCDESGVPALRRYLGSLSRLAVRPCVMALVSVRDAAYQDYLAHFDGFTLQWFIGYDEQTVSEHLSWLSVPANDYSVWITGKGKVVKSLCVRFETEAFGQQWVRATAYWYQHR